VRLEVYDATGRLVRVLRDGVVEQAAARMAVWDGTDDGGRPVASGVYFYRLEAGEFTETRSMVLLK
jgi:flagellar hook assembly protein FlgD